MLIEPAEPSAPNDPVPGAWRAVRRSAYRLAPLVSRVRGRLGFRATIAQIATLSWVVGSAIDAVSAPAVYEADDLHKVTGVAPDSHSTVATQTERLRGGMRHHDATVAYELNDVVLADGHLFTHEMAFPLDTTPMPVIAPAISQEFDHAVLANTPYGIRYFGHWLIDDLTLTLAARELGEPISALTRPSAHQTAYLQALQFGPAVMTSARFKKLIVLDDRGQNAHKIQRYGRLRDMLRQMSPAPANTGARRNVMLLRGENGSRRQMANEQEVATAMRARGFLVFDPTQFSLPQLVAACLDADMVLGVEGSQLANGVMWMKPGGTLVVIQPPQRFSTYFKDRCDCEDIRFAFIVGDAEPGGAFSVDVSRLSRLLDRLG